jgi:glycosyltransferase involved in cell wall biosynthesis
MPSPTPIAFCITDLDLGGAERALVQIVTRLDRSEWAPVVYCLSGQGELVSVLKQAGVETYCLNAGRRDVLVIWRLARLLRRQRPVLLQTFLFHANLAGRLAAWLAGVPIVVSGIRVAEREKTWHLRLERWTRRFVTHHVCVSQSVADFSERELGLSPESVSVIANGVDADAITAVTVASLDEFDIPVGEPVLLFVGRLHPQKGLMTLLEAMRVLVIDEHRKIQLLIAGAGPLEKEGRKFVAERGLGPCVHWLGARRDVPSLMRASTLLVLPSRWEGMPNVVLEAMAAGLPVVATAVDGTVEVVTSEITGTLCRPEDPRALADAIRSVLDAPEAARECADRAQQSVRKHFTWTHSAAAYVRLWRLLMAAHG